MTPEEKARVKIDQWFADAGWKVVNRDEYEPTISAVAIREGLLKGNLEADYFLFINGKAVGVLEAKREEINISSNIVSEQAITYAQSVPDCYQAWQKPLPFLFKSNGKETELGTFRLTETGDAKSTKEEIVCNAYEIPKFTLSWNHYQILMRIANLEERNFYEIEAQQQGWDYRWLQRQVGSSLYERLALSRNKNEVMRLATEGQVVCSISKKSAM